MKSEKPVVKYHNDLNKLTFQRFGQIDFDFFMVLCSEINHSDNSMVSISFREFKKLSGYSTKNTEERFIRDLKSMNYKQLLSTGEVKVGNKIRQFVLFKEFEIDPDNKVITAKVNEDYKYILKEITKNFTMFELQEFVSLDSKYAKTLYRLLKQFRKTGVYITPLDEFKRIMGIPESYTNMKIGQKIINPSVKALKPYFNNLSCEVQYEAKRGRPVKGYKFTFEPEKILKQIQEQEKPKKEKSKNSFHNFEQRTYDYNELEKMISKRW